MSKIRGQIELGTARGNAIYKSCLDPEVKTIVEIGTWNGRGSTACVLEAILPRGEDCEFYTLEVNAERYQQAKETDPIRPNIHFILGRIVEVEEFIMDGFPPDQPRLSEWLPISIMEHRSTKNVLDRLPEIIDFLILDGGEFTTKAELSILKDRTKAVFLDDTYKMKNFANRIFLLDSDSFEAVEDVPPQDGHHGWSIFRRV